MIRRESLRTCSALALAACISLPATAMSAPSPGRAHARTTKKRARKRRGTPAAKKLLNGRVEVDPHTGYEFDEWMDRFEFKDTPPKIEARWFQNSYGTTTADWALFEKGNPHPLASGDLLALQEPNQTRRFDIPLTEFLPRFNTGNKNKVYQLRVTSTSDAQGKTRHLSRVATLVHKPRSSASHEALDPFKCGSSPTKHKRVVTLRVPKVRALASTTTKGEGADELFFRVLRMGPGKQTTQHDVPGGDQAYKVVAPNNYGPFDFVNKDGASQNPPLLWAGEISHGETVVLGVLALEDDWEDLKSIKNGVIKAMDALAIAGKVAGGTVGDTIAAVAASVATVNRTYVPDIDSDDLLGGFGMQFTNRCGRIQTTWVAADGQHNGLISSMFVDGTTLEEIPQGAMNVLFAADPSTNDGFSPYGWDYGDWTYVGEMDEMYWATRGTSDSAYAFLLEMKTAVSPKTSARRRRRGRKG